MKKLIMFFSIMMLVSISQAKEFSDLPNDHWSYEYVQTLSDKGIINGYDDGTFKPNQAVTRAEFATIFIKSTNNESVSETPKTFEDVNESHWFYPYVEKSSDYIFTWGNKFYPNDSMKREEVAYAIVKSNGLDEKKTNLNILDRFNDKDSITEFFKPYVAMAVENGYMSGKGEGFDPQNGLTRAEICALFSKNQNSKNDVKLSEIIRLGIFGSDVKSDEKITRAEMSKIICQLAGISEYMVEPYENSVEYKDVKKGSEYIGWIYTSLRDDYFVLYDDDTFRPNEKMENIHGIILLEKVLGRTDYILKGSYPDNFIQDAKSIGMIEQDIDYEEILTYGTLANMIYNVLDIGIWEGNNNMIELIPDMSIRKNVHAISEENAFQYSMYKECDEVPDFGALLGYTLDKMDYTSGGLIYTYKVHSPKQDDLEQYAKILEDIKFEETAKTEQVTLFEKGNWTVMYTMNDSEYRIGILEKRNDDVGLKLSDDELNMKVGDKAKIEIDLESDLGMDLTLDVDNEILEIEWDEWEDFSTALIIKAVKDGKCIITVGIKGTDIKETVEVVVEPDIKTTLKAAKSKLNLEVGEDTKVNITATSSSEFSLKYKNSNSGVIGCEWGKFNNNNAPLYITAKREGTSYITVYLTNERGEELDVEIKVIVESEEDDDENSDAEDKNLQIKISNLESKIASQRKEVESIERRIENIANEKSGKVLIGGEWRATYDTAAMAEAREDLERAKTKLEKLEAELEILVLSQ